MLTLQGTGTSPGLASGPLCRNREDADPAQAAGSILVAERAVPDDVARIAAARGTLTLSGAFLSHVALLARELGRPCVSLDAGSLVRLVPSGGQGLIELADVVGGGDPAPLEEGDVVLLDGNAGTVRVPGGLDRGRRAEARGAHRALRSLCHGEGGDALRGVLEGDGLPALPMTSLVLEMAFLYGEIPPGPVAAALLRLCRSVPPLAPHIEGVLDLLRDRMRRAALVRLASALEAVTAAEQIDELDLHVRRALEVLSQETAHLRDLGPVDGSLDDLAGPVLRHASDRRGALIAQVERDVGLALEAPDSLLRAQPGRFLRLLHRASAAGLDPAGSSALERRLGLIREDERQSVGTRLVLTLPGEAPKDRGLVGGKALGLLDAWPHLPVGCRIPPGFVVTTSAYWLHLLGEAGRRLELAVVAEGGDAELSRRARAAVLSHAMPQEVVEAIGAAWTALGGGRLAVRSSATFEDGPIASLAGQFDTYLGVGDLPELLDRIRRCWASLWNLRALRAFAVLGRDPGQVSQAVLVQQMVETRAAGVLLSRDPTGRPDILLVNAAWGLGESISQGEVPGDFFRVHRGTGRLLTRDTGSARFRLALDPLRTGTVEIPLEPERRGVPCLSTEDLGRLAALARALEEATGRAQDVEFGFDPSGELVVFQVRRVATRERLGVARDSVPGGGS